MEACNSKVLKSRVVLNTVLETVASVVGIQGTRIQKREAPELASWVAQSSTEEHVSVGNPYFKRAFLIGYGSTHQPFIFIRGHALRLAILQTGDFARTSSNWEGK